MTELEEQFIDEIKGVMNKYKVVIKEAPMFDNSGNVCGTTYDFIGKDMIIYLEELVSW